MANGFKIVLGESRKPEKLWIDRGSVFYKKKPFKSVLKEHKNELYSTYSDLKVVFIEIFNRNLLHIINKSLFISDDGNWLNILNDADTTYNNNINSTINITPVDASNNPDKVKCVRKPASQIITSSKPSYTKTKFTVGNYVKNDDKRYIYYKGHTSKWKRVLFKINKVL